MTQSTPAGKNAKATIDLLWGNYDRSAYTGCGTVTTEGRAAIDDILASLKYGRRAWENG